MNVTRNDAAIGAFVDLVRAAWPDEDCLRDLPPPGTLALAWITLSRRLGLDSAEFAQRLAMQAGIAAAPAVLRPESSVIDVLPEGVMRTGLVLPLALIDGVLSVALANPVDDALLAQLRFATPHRLQLLLANPDDLEIAVQAAIARRDGSAGAGRLVLRTSALRETGDDALTVRVKRLLVEAVSLRASDVHIQPLLGGGVVRMRVDGLLRRVALLPGDEFRRICNFFQANGGMDPTNDRIPQDGSLSIDVEGRHFELRLSTLPARGGERLVIRLLEQDREFHLARNGFSVAEIQALRRMARHASGLLLMTGPTGSGKTSTLYGMLGEINSSTRSVITIENPVEYVLPGISQVEVNERAGLSFATALRSALRQDPNVLLVGEIRDQETAATAVQAALTGHVVLSTLHTNDALSAIPRLLDMGVTPAVLADSLVGIVAQRLCRRLCNACRVPVSEPLQQDEALFRQVTRIAPGYRAGGCAACHFTGYSGRLPIAEIVEVDAALRAAIVAGQMSTQQPVAQDADSLESLANSAARRIMSGDTSVKEAMRVLGRRFWADLARLNGTALPPEALALDTGSDEAALAVLLIGGAGDELDGIDAGLRRAWFDVLRAPTLADANNLLQANDNTCFIVQALPDGESDATLFDHVRKAQVDLAWARVPTALLVPAGRPELVRSLREKGLGERIIERPASATSVLQAVRGSLVGG